MVKLKLRDGNIKKFAKDIINNLYSRLFLYIFVPCLLISIVSLCIIYYTAAEVEKKEYSYCNKIMSSIIANAESNLTSISSVAKTFVLHDKIQTLFLADDMEYTGDVAKVINDFETSNSSIDSILVYDVRKNIVVDGDGQYTAEKYFTDITVYSNYDYSYWKDFRYYTSQPYRILSPGEMKTYNGSAEVIPIVFRKIGDFASNKYLIFNMDLKMLLSAGDLYSDTKAEFYILNKYTSNVFPLNSHSVTTLRDNEDFLGEVRKNPNSCFKYKLDNNYLVVTKSHDYSMIGYTYIAMLDLYEIYGGFIGFSIFIILFNLLLLAAATYISGKNAKKIYNPIKNTYATLSGNSYNTDKSILEEIEVLSKASVQKSGKYTAILPHAQRNYIINVLNGSDVYMFRDEDARADIEKSLNFRFENFSVVLLQVSPAFNFYERFSADEYEVIKIGFHNIVLQMFEEYFDTFVLPSEDDVLTVILNSGNEDCDDVIDSVLKNILSYLKHDFEYVKVSLGVGYVHQGIEGLKQSHNEAMSNFIIYNTPSNESVVKMKNSKTDYLVHINEMNLFTVLSSFDKNKIINTINSFFSKNDDMSLRDIKTTYNYIVNAILSFMHTHEIEYMDGELYDYEIVERMLSQSIVGIRSEVEYLIEYICKQRRRDVHFNDLIAYIDDNYSMKELSLEYLSDEFNMSQSNITRIIQSATGMPFKKYLAKVRVDKAKAMLVSTDYSVEKICDMTGFASRRTFFRIFKAETGTTPGEYKK